MASRTEKRDEAASYAVRTDTEVPVLLKFNTNNTERFDPTVKGEWLDIPLSDRIRIGEGSFMSYDDISAEEAEKYKKIIRAAKCPQGTNREEKTDENKPADRKADDRKTRSDRASHFVFQKGDIIWRRPDGTVME